MIDLKDPEILRTVLGGLQSGVCLMDRARKILFWNDGAERITGYLRHEVLGHACNENVLKNCDEAGCSLCDGLCPLREALQDGKRREAGMYFHHKDGHRVPVHVWSVPIRDEHGSLLGVAESFDGRSSTVEQRRSQHSLAAYGCLDETTDIPNRGFTEFHLRENLAKFAEYQVPFAVLLTRIENFESLKHTYGREALDTILGLVSRTLRGSIRPVDFLGRWAEDEFLTIALNCGASGVNRVVERVRRILHYEGIQWWGDELFATTSLGSAAVESGDTIESLLRRAEQSLKHGLAKTAAAGSGEQPGPERG
jgi:diguanylate cyclase (GGDEF)-like protein/PAS domain S-box-containing protein